MKLTPGVETWRKKFFWKTSFFYFYSRFSCQCPSLFFFKHRFFFFYFFCPISLLEKNAKKLLLKKIQLFTTHVRKQEVISLCSSRQQQQQQRIRALFLPFCIVKEFCKKNCYKLLKFCSWIFFSQRPWVIIRNRSENIFFHFLFSFWQILFCQSVIWRRRVQLRLSDKLLQKSEKSFEKNVVMLFETGFMTAAVF